MDKLIITVVGKDRVGIIARVCIYLSENGINILDISQTIVSGFFNMIVIADPEKCSKDFDTVSEELKAVGEEIGVTITTQREGIFEAMHRI